MEVTRLHNLKGHNSAIYTLQPSDQENIFFSSGGDGMVALWDLIAPENGQLIARLPNSVYGLHFHQPTGLLIAGQNFEGIHVLDWKNKTELASLNLTKSAIFDIQSRDGELVVAGGDGSVCTVDLEKMMVTRRAKESERNARTIAINRRNGDMAVGFSDHFIRVFDHELKLKHAWKAHLNSVFTLRYLPESDFLISGSRDARLKVWDANADYKQQEEIVAHMYAINHVDFSPDGKHFVTCSMDKSIKVWDTGGLKLLKVIDKARHAGHGTSVNKLLWTSYQNQLVSASDDRTLSVWGIIF